MLKFEKAINSAIPSMQPIKIVGEYGKGQYSVIYKITSGATMLALRVSQEESKNVGEEVVQKKLSAYDMAPIIHAEGLVEGKNCTIMDPIVMDLAHYLKTPFNVSHLSHAFKCLLDKKYVLRVLHGDMHTENIAILMDGISLGFIDFGFSLTNVDPVLTVLDFIPLLGSLRFNGKITKPIEHLITYLLQYYKDTFNIIIDMHLVNQGRDGGYVYKGLNSYIKLANAIGMKKTTVKDVMAVFPTLSLPKMS